MKFTTLIFDLDGVLVDTAKYHYLAWKRLADELCIPFTEQDNERFKGVSRTRCMDILLELGKRTMTGQEKAVCSDKKNGIYVDYIKQMGEDEVLPGVKTFLGAVRAEGYHTALGSASKNTALILDRLHLAEFFDVVVDGTQVTKAKPDPAVFLRGAVNLGVGPKECIVFEDAVAGIQAAHAGGMTAVGVGSKETLYMADLVIPGFSGVTIADIETALAGKQK